MKHRKFVKQLMSMHLDRNKAEEMAVHCQRNRVPYADGLKLYKHLLDSINRQLQKELENAILYGYSRMNMDFCQPKQTTLYCPRVWHDCRIAPATGIVKIKAVE